MPKQESIFEETRPEMFKNLFEAELDEVLGSIRPAGRKSGHPVYVGGANRKRARILARMQARHKMRLYRSEQPGESYGFVMKERNH